jgi:hypothetical protein
MKNKKAKQNKRVNNLSEETKASLREYGEVLRSIHNRLISEGYIWSNGKFLKKG